MKKQNLTFILAAALLSFTILSQTLSNSVFAATQQSSGSVGVEGTIPSGRPTQAPTITTPATGQAFSAIPITVAGLCQSNLLIEVFKNGVFSGSALCQSGSFSLTVDLFSGRNDLIARAYDSLNQASPDSNKVSVTFNDSLPGKGPRISLTSAYAKRGAAPGETLTWPLSVSGGTPPYAISIDWGDKSAPDLVSQSTAGNFTIEHIYDQSGVYNITIKASDVDGAAAFLQVVGIGNGPIQQTAATAKPTTVSNVSNKLLIILLIISLLFIFSSFWLGKKHQLQLIRTRLRRGQRPF